MGMLASWCVFRSVGRLELILPRAAEGAHPVVRDALEGGTGRHAVVRVAVGRVVDVAADDASPFFHRTPPLAQRLAMIGSGIIGPWACEPQAGPPDPFRRPDPALPR